MVVAASEHGACCFVGSSESSRVVSVSSASRSPLIYEECPSPPRSPPRLATSGKIGDSKDEERGIDGSLGMGARMLEFLAGIQKGSRSRVDRTFFTFRQKSGVVLATEKPCNEITTRAEYELIFRRTFHTALCVMEHELCALMIDSTPKCGMFMVQRAWILYCWITDTQH